MRRDGIEAVGASTPVGADQIVDSFCTNNEVADIYTLQVGKDGEERLNILNELYNSLTEKFLERVGIRSKTSILDVACGTGEISCWMAQQISGKVVAIDISEKQLEIAERRAKSLGLKNIEFVKLSAFDLAQLDQMFDLIYCRFLLVHIQNPDRVLELMYNCLSEDGVLACEEATASVSFCYPPSPAFDKWLALWAALRKANGTDLDLGLKLPQMFREAKFLDVATHLVQPVLGNSREKSVLRLNTIETTKAAVKIGFDTEEGMQCLAEDLGQLEQSDHLIGYVRNSQVCGYKMYGLFAQDSHPETSEKQAASQLHIKSKL